MLWEQVWSIMLEAAGVARRGRYLVCEGHKQSIVACQVSFPPFKDSELGIRVGLQGLAANHEVTLKSVQRLPDVELSIGTSNQHDAYSATR